MRGMWIRLFVVMVVTDTVRWMWAGLFVGKMDVGVVGRRCGRFRTCSN